jgi:Skp family chaperone for outer membrane proteins
MKHKLVSFFSLKNIIIIVLVLCVLIASYFAYSNYKWALYQNSRVSQLENDKNNLQSQINNLNSEISTLNSQIRTKDSTIASQKIEIEQKRQEILRLEQRVNDLEEELGITKSKLQETTELYQEAQPYQERVNRGQNLYQYYVLLDDREDYAKPIVLDYLGLSSPVAPANDDALWERGRLIYNWISNNFDYCGDKGLRVGTTFYEFQFYSPDELLMSDNSRCGDCDDFATLFAGLMYASGVPENKVWVVCGLADGGGHCWNWLSLTGQTYRIDPVCSQKQTVINILGLDLGVKGAYYTSSKGNVQCFSEYDEQMKMNPQGVSMLT